MASNRPGVKTKIDPSIASGLADRTYTTREVADIFEVTIDTVRAWIRRGELLATLGTTRQGHSISRESLTAFAIKRYQS